MLKHLIPLNLPKPELKFARKKEELYVWDPIRKKYLKLTPEEWVRQHFVCFLLSRQYPRNAIALEGGFHLHTRRQRTDILIYKNASPAAIVECKAPQVKLSQAVFDQAARYNLHYKTRFLIVSNGLHTYVASVDQELQSYTFLKELPSFHEI